MKSYAKFFPKIKNFDALFEAATEHAQLNTRSRQSLFLATVAHESAYLTKLEEDLTRYTPKRLAEVWPRRFADAKGNPNIKAAVVAGDPYLTAEAAYGGREGNGPEGSGDGYAFRGGGAIHLTLKNNYAAVSKRLGLGDMFVEEPELVRTPQYALLSSADWWIMNRMNLFADDIGNGYLATGYDPWIIQRKKVNGSDRGLDEVKKIYKKLMV